MLRRFASVIFTPLPVKFCTHGREYRFAPSFRHSREPGNPRGRYCHFFARATGGFPSVTPHAPGESFPGSMVFPG